MKKKTLLFFSLLLVALSAGAQVTTLWDASADNVDVTYGNVKSYTTGSSSPDASTLDYDDNDKKYNKWFNTKNNEHYMVIGGGSFTETESATGYKITITVNYSNGNEIYFSSSADLNGNIGKIQTPSDEKTSNTNYTLTISTDQLSSMKTSGLFISGVYLNWNKITIEPIMSETPKDPNILWVGSENNEWYKDVIKSYKKGTTTEDNTAFDYYNRKYIYNTNNDEYYMYIPGSCFQNIKKDDEIKVNITYNNNNNLNFAKDNNATATYGTINGNDTVSYKVTEEDITTLKSNGLYLGGTYLNWDKVWIEPYVPITIADEVTARFNQLTSDQIRKSWTIGQKMADEGYADINKETDGTLNYEGTWIKNGSSFKITTEELSEVQAGDILYVFVEKCAEHTAKKSEYTDYNDQEVNDGGNGAWAGFQVADGWLAPKQHCFPIKGDFYKILDKHMVSLIKTKGLQINGCKYQLDYVAIVKGQMKKEALSEYTEYDLLPTGTTSITTEDNWKESTPKLTIPSDVTKEQLTNAQIEVTYTYKEEENQIQILSNNKAYGAYQPSEPDAGAYTTIGWAENGTVKFDINTEEKVNNIKDYGFVFKSKYAMTISSVKLLIPNVVERITGNEALYENETGAKEVQLATSTLKDKKIYWGEIIYVEYDNAGEAPTATYPSNCTDAQGNTISGLRGKFINSDGNGKSWFLYLDYTDTKNFRYLATTENSPNLTIKANGDNAKILKITALKESRRRNSTTIKPENGELDWTSSSRVQVNIGQVEIGDKIKVHTKKSNTDKKEEFQASIMHNGEKNTKGLAYNNVFKFADIYDVLSYSRSDEKAKEYIERQDEFTYIVGSQYMANQLSKFPFTLAGQNTVVTEIEVASKAFVFDASIGYSNKPLYWGTLCCPYNLQFLEGGSTHAWIITGVGKEDKEKNEYALTVKEVHNVPAGTPILISKDEIVYKDEVDKFAFNVVDDKDKFTADAVEWNKNLLCGEIVDKYLQNDNEYTYYKLSYQEDSRGNEKTAFFKLKDNTSVKNSAGKSYLRLSKATAVNAKAFVFKFDNDNETTGIDNINNANATTGEKIYYNLNGQRISQPTHSGVYICNGKKIIIK